MRRTLLLICFLVIRPCQAFAEKGSELFLKIRNDQDGAPIALETGILTFKTGSVSVDLVAAVHIGEQSYYQELNNRFRSYDRVLYELVAPPNTRPAQDAADDQSALSDAQRMVTELLDLTFQLDEIDYRPANFVHADLSPEEMGEAFRRGGGLSPQALVSLLTLIPPSRLEESRQLLILPVLFLPQGELRAIMLRKLLAKSFLSIDQVLEALASGGVGAALIDARNKAALRVLEREVAGGAERVAIFFGAAHLPDIAQELELLGYQPGEHRWLTAWHLKAGATHERSSTKRDSGS